MKSFINILNRYGFLGSLNIFKSYLFTKLFYNNSRLIRFPFDIRNAKYINLGHNLTTGFGCRIEAFPQFNTENCISFGDNIEINDYVHIAAAEKIVIGNNVLIASKVFITDINHGIYNGSNSDSPLTIPNKRLLSTKPVIINDNVWIGEGVCILPGVIIGKGSIIGSLSVVTKDVPPYSIVAGIPAKVIKLYDFMNNKWIKKH